MKEKIEAFFKTYIEEGKKNGCNGYAYAAGGLKSLATSLAEALERIATNKTDDPVGTAKFALKICLGINKLEEE